MSANYGWIISADQINSLLGLKTEVGVCCPRNIAPEIRERLKAGQGEEFRMRDDDGAVYYEGRIICDPDSDPESAFRPLDDFGMPNAGCTSIEYKSANTGAWERL